MNNNTDNTVNLLCYPGTKLTGIINEIYKGIVEIPVFGNKLFNDILKLIEGNTKISGSDQKNSGDGDKNPEGNTDTKRGTPRAKHKPGLL